MPFSTKDEETMPSASALASALAAAGVEPLAEPRNFSRDAAQQALDLIHPHAITLGDPEHPLRVASRILAMVVAANGPIES